MAIHKNSSEGILCVDCNKPADSSTGDVMPLCTNCLRVFKLKKKAMEGPPDDSPKTIRALAETGDIHGDRS